MTYLSTLADQALNELTMVIVKRLLEQKADHATITAVIDDIKAWSVEVETRAAEHNQQANRIYEGFLKGSLRWEIKDDA